MLNIEYLSELDVHDLLKASQILEQLPEHRISCNNWPEAYPYTPQAKFYIAHNGDMLFLKFRVSEQYTMAKISVDNGEAWTDSCVEFFLALDDSGYYNFEFTCIGKALLGFRKERPDAVHGTPEIMQSIRRYTTLGEKNFDEKEGDNIWELTVAIPASTLFRHQIKKWSGIHANVNAYKCGDNLSKPHYLSWKPINTPSPDFHVPRCFYPVIFE